MKVLNSVIGTLVVVSASAFSAPSQAVMMQRTAVNHAVATCHGTTATFDDMLKVRAQGMSNGALNKVAVVNCGGVATQLNNDGSATVFIYEVGLDNLGNSDITVNCSLVDSIVDGSGTVATVFPKTVIVPAHGANYIDWNVDDNAGKNFTYPSITCQLPTNAEVSYTATMYNEDVSQ